MQTLTLTKTLSLENRHVESTQHIKLYILMTSNDYKYSLACTICEVKDY